jgi:hypothetical protein
LQSAPCGEEERKALPNIMCQEKISSLSQSSSFQINKKCKWLMYNKSLLGNVVFS